MLRQKSDILSWFTPWEWPGDDPGGRGGGLRGGGAAIPGFPQDPLCGTAQERTGLTQTQLGKGPGSYLDTSNGACEGGPKADT